MTDLTPDAIAEIARVTDAATPGPWHVRAAHDGRADVWKSGRTVSPYVLADRVEDADAEFIALARTAIPDLLAALTAKDEEIAGLWEGRTELTLRIRALEEALTKTPAERGMESFTRQLAAERERDLARQQVAELTAALRVLVDNPLMQTPGEHRDARALLARIETPPQR